MRSASSIERSYVPFDISVKRFDKWRVFLIATNQA
jgi:hypothetical protein